jgi:hypothetical protein
MIRPGMMLSIISSHHWCIVFTIYTNLSVGKQLAERNRSEPIFTKTSQHFDTANLLFDPNAPYWSLAANPKICQAAKLREFRKYGP